MANVCDKFRQNFRQTFIEQVVSMFGNLSTDKWFLSIGKPLPWLSSTGEEDNFPPASEDTNETETDFWRNIVAHKKINREDVSIIVPRYDWTIGTVYRPYRPDVFMFDPDTPYVFYVLVDEERVYKCIDNNYNAPSVVAPTHTDTEVKTLSDGYRWKYMYSITDSKRKFLLKSGLKKSGIIRPGYMPVENIQSLGLDDERYLQFAVQNSAVDGEVVFVYFKPEYSGYVVSDRCVFPSSTNLLASDVPFDGTTASIFSTDLAPITDYYNEMVFSVDSGQGQGQRRIIKSYTPSGGNSAIVEFTTPISVELISSNSTFSIVPNVCLLGDGSAKNNTLDPLRTVANVSVKFASGETGTSRTVQSFEMVDTGKDYTYASFKVVKGLTFSSATPAEIITDFQEIATPIISPQGGHGSNPVYELGGKSMMIVKRFSGNEGGRLSVQNEFRQFGILKNPDLYSPQYRISTVQAGTMNSFVAGATAYQSQAGEFTGAYGKIVSWHEGLTGYTGTSELIVTDVVGTFKAGVASSYIGLSGAASTLQVFDVMERTRAGTEGRDLLVLTVAPSLSPSFLTLGNDFPRGLNAVGVGNATENVEFTGSKGKIHRWEGQAGFSNRGRLYLEHSHGEFYTNELVGTRDRYMTLVAGLTGIARIIEKDEIVEEIPEIYSQVHRYELASAFGDTFSDSTFEQDQEVIGYDGSTVQGTGVVVSWETSGATGTISLLMTDGEISTGNIIPYVNSSDNTVNSLVSSIVEYPALKYRSGQVQYIQNMRPIVRSETQEEEIKLIIEI
jgi:hypothetical protein